MYYVLPAFCYLANKITSNIPNVKAFCILNCGLKNEIIDNYVKICNHYGIEVIHLKDIDKTNEHPTVKGMNQIKEQILDKLIINNN